MSEHEIFLSAIEIDSLNERAAYLADACNGNAVLRQQVDSLLAAHEQPGEFLDVPALRQMADGPAPDATNMYPSSVQDDLDLSFLEPSTAPASLGRLLHYEVRQVIGRGGCGIVLKAFDEKLERVVAIKVMAPELAATSPARKRFLREARAAAAIRHVNVVSIHAVEEQPLPFLVMEYIAGETLQQRLDRTGPLDVRELLSIGRQIANGLAAAHAKGLIHRDIKPANILLEDGTGHLKITDFGLARSADDASMTQSGVIAGTPLYMSPEQAQAQDIDHRSDLFSLGSVLYVMCSGRPPFRAASSIAVLRRVVEEQPRPIQNIIPEVPEWLAAIIARLHAKNPLERFDSAQEVSDLLGRCLTEFEQHGRVDLAGELRTVPRKEAGPVAEDPVPSLPEQVTATRHPRWIAAAALVLAVVTGLGMAEATGMTNIRSTVIRLFSPGGTLIVEVDDPGVSVSIDGEEMVITGTGAKEIRLKPGQYTLLASKDGKVLRQELVTVTTNGRQVVRVSRDPEASQQPAALPRRAVVPPAASALLTSLSRDQIPLAKLAFAGDGDPQKAPPSLVAVLGEPEPVHRNVIGILAFSADRRWLLSASERMTLLREAATGRIHRVFELDSNRSAAFTPDSQGIVTLADDKVQLWPISGESAPTTLLKLEEGQMRMALSPDGRFLAVGGKEGAAKLWKWGQWDAPTELPIVGSGGAFNLAFSHDSRLLACATWPIKDKAIPVALYTTSDGKLKQTLSGHQDETKNLSFSRDGRYLATTGPPETRVWDTTTGKFVKFVKRFPPGRSAAFSPDGKWLITLNDWTGEIFDVSSGVEAKTITSRPLGDARGPGNVYSSFPYAVAFSPDSNLLAVGDYSGTVNVFDTNDWQLKKEFLESGSHNSITSIAVSPDGATVLSRGLDMTLRRWNMAAPAKPELVHVFMNPKWHQLEFSPDGRSFATVDYKNLTVWDAATSKPIFTDPIWLGVRSTWGPHGRAASNRSMVYSSDGKLLAIHIPLESQVRLFDVRLRKEVYHFAAPAENVALAFSADSNLLAAADNEGNIVIWNVTTGNKVAAWKDKEMHCVAFRPDDQILATGHADGTISLWNTATWQKDRSVSFHKGEVTSLKYTPDSRWLVSGGTDGMIQVRNPNWQRPLAVIPVGPPGPVVVFDLDASGQYLFTSGPTNVIYVHRLPPSD